MYKKNKGILILVGVVLSLYFIIYLFSNIQYGKKYSNTVFLGDMTKLNIKGNNIEVLDEYVSTKKQKVKIYYNNRFIDGYLLTSKDNIENGNYAYNLYDSSMNPLYPESLLIAHTPDISIMVKETNKTNSEDLTEVYNFVNSQNIILSSSIELDYLSIDNFDYDNDGTEEYIYSVGLIKDADEYDSFVFYKENDNYILIDRIENGYDEVANVKLIFEKLIDFNDDDKYEFVIGRIMSEYGPYYYDLYNFNGNSFTKIGG